MLQSERYEKIEALVNERGIVNTKDISALLGVTEKTIRLDYEELEKQGRLVRVHGGAKSIRKKIVTTRDERWIRERNVHVQEKNAAAKRAAEMVEEGSCIFLDGGSSVAPILKYLKDKEVKIVTNSQPVVEAFDSDKAELYILGGSYIPKYGMTAGPLTVADMSSFNFDYAFISCLGADVERRQIYTAEMDTMAVKHTAMKCAACSVLMLDMSKLYIKSFCNLVSTDEFDAVICGTTEPVNKKDYPDNFIFAVAEAEE